nr:hypothetical protein [Pseudofulvimonas gallinarii]
MRDHHQVGDVAAGDETVQLAGQATRGTAFPHVTGEVAVHDDVIGLVRQTLADGIDKGTGPVVGQGIGLVSGAVHEGDTGIGHGGQR